MPAYSWTKTTGVPEPSSSTWSLTPSGAEIFGIVVLFEAPAKRVAFVCVQTKASQVAVRPQAAKKSHVMYADQVSWRSPPANLELPRRGFGQYPGGIYPGGPDKWIRTHDPQRDFGELHSDEQSGRNRRPNRSQTAAPYGMLSAGAGRK